MEIVRPPAVAGMFYPADERKLKEEVKFLLDFSKDEEIPPGRISALVVPHAGYIYSGRTAAYAYNMIRNKDYRTVVVISPSHREYFPGISVYSGDAYKTPLGVIPVNKEMREEITKDAKFIFKGLEGHRQEHALEVQLPFLQMLLKDFEILPIVIGDQKEPFLNELSDRLSKVLDDRTLIVASSDLSHFHTKQEADRLDSVVERRISEFDYRTLLRDLDKNTCEACGGGPIVAAMRTAELLNARKAKVLNRSDSGDVTGDNSEVVGYLSAVIYE
ncbi:MAG: AmmeMemoRadiSam system protein B [Ignavibacteria bacterium]|jgi:AmmeMemoRadiSam system protein B|nr:AmmeMemoRadiSam system protein B [Ignavibacteria bacterium]MCU7502743.1 AmmeMemoRadiSam system protein B [Ignavibacteria bacterium]MCU7517328.1 AmmeMemoRadiSam system protein B [Ignavibacteria bacterium]